MLKATGFYIAMNHILQYKSYKGKKQGLFFICNFFKGNNFQCFNLEPLPLFQLSSIAAEESFFCFEQSCLQTDCDDTQYGMKELPLQSIIKARCAKALQQNSQPSI